MNVEKANESVSYDVELEDDKHFSVTFDTDCNIGYTRITVLSKDGVELKDGTELHQRIMDEVDSFKERENDSTR